MASLGGSAGLWSANIAIDKPTIIKTVASKYHDVVKVFATFSADPPVGR
jgi:hypothetical protein